MGIKLPIVDVHLLVPKQSSNGTNISGHLDIISLLSDLLAAKDVFILQFIAQRTRQDRLRILFLQGSLVGHFLAFPLVLFSFVRMIYFTTDNTTNLY
jgi:hypothetical protein